MQLCGALCVCAVLRVQWTFAEHHLMKPLHASNHLDDNKTPLLSTTWQILGPFQIGTRGERACGPITI